MGCDGDPVTGDEWSAYQRAAVVTVRLMRGQRLRTRDVMRVAGLRQSGALKLMGHLAAIPDLAVVLDDDGCWRLIVREEGSAVVR
jgi:hypothetical protein